MPRIELLLLYKVKALCDRRYDLQHLTLSAVNKAYIDSKIWKDEHDIKKLSERPIDEDKIRQMAKEVNFYEYFKREAKRLKIW